ncbi:unnamed protein product [Phyllotreta striolata]|uniref:Uncharacterized protein n=1 Tax=Phyllotreta striolata TaxID=444603 RepID=A0A9P0E1J5_PHYSR|nr:unnamed protein product [Phyllotreta striolata]
MGKYVVKIVKPFKEDRILKPRKTTKSKDCASRIIKCRERALRKYERSGSLEDEAEYISICNVVKRVMGKAKAKAKGSERGPKEKMARNLERSIGKLVAKNVKSRLIMRLTDDYKHEVLYKGTHSAITQLVKLHRKIQCGDVVS